MHIFHICIVAIVAVIGIAVVIVVASIICDRCIAGTIDIVIIRFLFQFHIVDVVELMIGEHGPDTVISHISDARILACR